MVHFRSWLSSVSVSLLSSTRLAAGFATRFVRSSSRMASSMIPPTLSSAACAFFFRFSVIDLSLMFFASANGAYSHYTTTREEYGVQRYEGGSTIYSPATLEGTSSPGSSGLDPTQLIPGYQNIFSNLVPFLASNTTTSPSPGTPPPNLLGSALSLQTGVIYDGPPLFKKFGNVLTDVKATPYVAGSTVSAVFVGANPRNHLRLEDT